MDALSDVLRAVRLNGAIFFDVHASDPWAAETPAGNQIVGRMFPAAEHLICYHAITQGTCWAAVGNQPPLMLSAGDVVVIPHGHAHVLSSAPGLRGAQDVSRYRAPSELELPVSITMGGGTAESAGFVCGFLGCDARPYNPLLGSLPQVFKVSDQVDGPLGSYVQIALTESKRPRIGSESVLGRLSELMFVDVIRRYLETLPADRLDWLAGLRDPYIGRALAEIHREPARHWTLESLARQVAMSRSAFAEHFSRFVGTPPMQYLTNWRMQIAANHLLSTTDSVNAVARRVGYDSEAAFSRAFKKAVGSPPSEWRRQRAVASTAPARAVQEETAA
ncbi:MAG TPA: AraC family transcriptional regulator [Steroidobacteraceae bacterium]|jgi:AraC-like DNA-binding protein|nr:AraC family transcriptional regulator [Steroidobacteraceae bacterium]